MKLETITVKGNSVYEVSRQIDKLYLSYKVVDFSLRLVDDKYVGVVKGVRL